MNPNRTSSSVFSEGCRRDALSSAPCGICVLVGDRKTRIACRFLRDGGASAGMKGLGQSAKRGIGLRTRPTATTFRFKWTPDDVVCLIRGGRLHFINEECMPRQMLVESIPERIASIVGYRDCRVIAEPLAYVKAFRDAGNLHGLSVPTMRKRREINFFYGRRPNATISQGARCGGKGGAGSYGYD
ncbi:hypothetical protein ABH945_003706 [Paraburkholderia sp. GAS333]